MARLAVVCGEDGSEDGNDPPVPEKDGGTDDCESTGFGDGARAVMTFNLRSSETGRGDLVTLTALSSVRR